MEWPATPIQPRVVVGLERAAEQGISEAEEELEMEMEDDENYEGEMQAAD